MELFLSLPGGCVGDGSSIKPIQSRRLYLSGDTPMFLTFYYVLLDGLRNKMSFSSGRSFENGIVP
jgi:hypothetical protein